jgi:prepilin-type N-terminal cleavage/methylation domain-containing protein
MKRYFANQQGFTLMELMIGLALTGLLMAGVFGLLSSSLQSWRLGSGKTELQQTARYAVDKMARDLHHGKSFQVTDPYTVVFVDSFSGNTYQYYLDRTSYILYRQPVNPAGVSQPVTGVNVQNSTNVLINQSNQVLFVSPDSNTVKITVTATDTNTNQSVFLRTAIYSQPGYLH